MADDSSLVLRRGRVTGAAAAEDEPVVSNHVPADRVSIEYRRWLRELALAALAGPDAYGAALGTARKEQHTA